MAVRKTTWVIAGVALAGVCAFVSTLAAQMPWRVYISLEGYDNIPVPTDYQEKTEWIFARLMYPPHPFGRFSRPVGFPGGWTNGGTSWSQDYPRADRHFAQALRRLTRLHVR